MEHTFAQNLTSLCLDCCWMRSDSCWFQASNPMMARYHDCRQLFFYFWILYEVMKKATDERESQAVRGIPLLLYEEEIYNNCASGDEK
mmetsp:Transcript_24816/g.39279  ORF Transcript_24816/g.39279 Transcript_24816/m.39279 type:complete len:88 (-) Transcript_24816:46-309(-)